MSLIITGDKGFIGKRLVKNHIKDYVSVDLKSGDDIFTTDKIKEGDVIIHLAAKTSVPISLLEPYETYHENIVGTQEMLNKKPSKIVFASSGSIYDPASPYAMSKLICEELIRSSGIPYCILRFGNVYGPGDGKSVIMHFENEDEIVINGDGSQMRSFIYVDDVASAINMGLEMEGTFAVDHQFKSILDVAKLFNKPIHFRSALEGEAKKYRHDVPHIENWKPTVTIEEYVKHTMENKK